jgi:hypothetical protein
MWNWLFVLPGRILCEQCPWCQRKATSMLFTCLVFSGPSDFNFPWMAHAFSGPLFSEICTKFDAIVKNQHVLAAAYNFVNLLPRYASTIIYRCISLLQLLYWWQHQSRKLLIPPRMDTYLRIDCSHSLNWVFPSGVIWNAARAEQTMLTNSS